MTRDTIFPKPYQYRNVYYYDLSGEVVQSPALFRYAPIEMVFTYHRGFVHVRSTCNLPFSQTTKNFTESFPLEHIEDFDYFCSEKSLDIHSDTIGHRLFDDICSYSDGVDHAMYQLDPPSDYPDNYWIRVIHRAYDYLLKEHPDDEEEMRRLRIVTETALPFLVQLHTLYVSRELRILRHSHTLNREIDILIDLCREFYPDDGTSLYDYTIAEPIKDATIEKFKNYHLDIVTVSRIKHSNMTYRDLYLTD